MLHCPGLRPLLWTTLYRLISSRPWVWIQCIISFLGSSKSSASLPSLPSNMYQVRASLNVSAVTSRWEPPTCLLETTRMAYLIPASILTHLKSVLCIAAWYCFLNVNEMMLNHGSNLCLASHHLPILCPLPLFYFSHYHIAIWKNTVYFVLLLLFKDLFCFLK